MRAVHGVYFSGTGTTKKIVNFISDKLAERLNLKKEEFDFTLPNVRKEIKVFSSGDIVVFGVPVIAGRVPNVLLKYLDTIEGNGALVIPVVLYGNRNYDDALIELRDILKKDGFKPIGAGAFIGEHSFSKILGGGRPDREDLKTADYFAEKIYEKITAPEFDPDKLIEVRGEEPYRYYYQPRDSKGVFVDIRKVTPKTNESCDNCKLCTEICPMGSIDYDDPKKIIGICIKCCACVKRCPKGAKYYDHEGYLYHQHELEDLYKRRAEPELFY